MTERTTGCVPSLVEAPDGAVLARWEDIRVGDLYRSPYDGKRYRRVPGDDTYDKEMPHILFWCWSEPPKPVTVEVDVELLERLASSPMVNRADRDAARVAIDAALADSTP